MKKFLTSILLFSCLMSFACWVNEGNGTSIQTTDYYVIRMAGSASESGTLTVAIPAQMDALVKKPCTLTLQYRLVEGATWNTIYVAVRTAININYIPIWGRNTFTSTMIGNSTTFQYRIQIVDGVEQNFPLSELNTGAITVNVKENKRPQK